MLLASAAGADQGRVRERLEGRGLAASAASDAELAGYKTGNRRWRTKKSDDQSPEAGDAVVVPPPVFMFFDISSLHTGMKHTTFREWLARQDEGLLLPDRPYRKGLSRINATPFTNAQRAKLLPKKVKTIKPFAPTVQAVKQIVPNKIIPKLKPLASPAKRVTRAEQFTTA